ncbi:hypothetical protein JCM8547_005982 [Rhodosporidiobolus lusitaniae]
MRHEGYIPQLDFAVHALRRRQTYWSRPPTTLASLALVNTEFAALCAPYLWSNIDLLPHSCKSIRLFIETNLPRHVQYVRNIRFGAMDKNELVGKFGRAVDQDGSLVEAAKALISSNSEMSDLTTTSPNEIKEAFMAAVFARCPSVELVRVEVLPLNTGTSRILDSLTATSPLNLNSLSIHVHITSARHVESFVARSSLPRLRRLSLQVVGARSHAAPNDRISSMATAKLSMASLTALSVSAPAAFFSGLIALTSPIRHVKLVSIGDLYDLSPIITLLSSISTTLESLHESSLSHVRNASRPQGPPLSLPALTRLHTFSRNVFTDLRKLAAALPALSPSRSPRASLSTLPPELKLRVIEEVVEGFEEELDNHYDDEPIPSLQSRFDKYKQPTSLVDGAFESSARSAVLSSCSLSQAVNLVDLPVETLFVLFREILPKHALSIKKLVIGQELKPPRSKMLSAKQDKQAEVVRAVQELFGQRRPSLEPYEAEDIIAARIVQQCASVEELHLVSAARQEDEHPLRTVSSTVRMAVSWSLKVLRVDVALRSFPLKHPNQLLQSCSATLVNLTLAVPMRTEEDKAFALSPRAKSLAQSISDLPHLRHLALIGFDSRLLPTLSNLQHLELAKSRTLTYVEEEGYRFYSSSSRIALPFLSRLSLYDSDLHLVNSRNFDLSAIEHLSLEVWSGSVENLRDFVKSSSTLRRISCAASTRFLDYSCEDEDELKAEFAALGRACEAKGVEVILPDVPEEVDENYGYNEDHMDSWRDYVDSDYERYDDD